MSKATETSKSRSEYIPIPLDSLRVESTPEFDLYIKSDRDYRLYRAKRLRFDEEHRISLIDNGVRYLYVDSGSLKEYRKYVESQLKNIIGDKSVSETSRANILYGTAIHATKDLLSRPNVAANVRRCRTIVESTVVLVTRVPRVQRLLSRMLWHDYYTYTHSMNVCVYSVTLARAVGIGDEHKLNVIGSGGLFHDVGKAKVPDDILKSLEPLSTQEWSKIRKHPQWGLEILKETDLLDDESYYPVIEHHERENGSGYPFGLCSEEIHYASKIVAIADAFDAMTTNRSFKPAVDSYHALKAILDDKGCFDREVAETFVRVMGPESRQL